ncbi:MAG: GH3 auxin-responsive promoter family protein [Clostridiaceae bacterium]|nr:GH3 auxin-responsive promoter family protein [Clostridiaceae bacterium]
MKFEDKLKHMTQEELWQEYCGFLDLSIDEYMAIQYRLLSEQIQLFSACSLGNRIFRGQTITSTEDFRKLVPLTTYDDYADILLLNKEEMLPAKPVVWLKTTWEGGTHPAKTAPYSAAMLDTYKNNIFGAMLIATSTAKGKFKFSPNARVLYALAPLPYATGLLPGLIEPEISFQFMPSIKEAQTLSFSQQTKRGFELSLRHGMDMFFGMSSILMGISRNLTEMASSSGRKSLSSILKLSPFMLYRLISAKYRSKRDGKPVLPKDIFNLQGFVCVGTDSALYKDELEELWGRRPLELAGGTEPSCLGTETWSKNGLVFFPDNCFYEFIPESEMLRNIDDPNYIPKTYLMDELVANCNYELVITVFKGGAFARYRVGDIYRCIRLKNPIDGLDIPQFEYVDRVPTVIDIAGFTRITQRVIEDVIRLSRLQISDWFALKEYDENNHSFMHLYAEMDPACVDSVAISKQLITEHLGAYFRFYDKDYSDLKRLLGSDPLNVTILPSGSIATFKNKYNRSIPKINPPLFDIVDITRLAKEMGGGDGI